MSDVLVRFAPSPTGLLHVGNIRPALMNFLFARGEGGRFLLRIDDTDPERSKAEFEDALKQDLEWLGLSWDLTDNQSRRLALYDAAAARLKADGLLYPCYETEDELERRRKLRRARGLPPVYDRAALNLTDDEKAAFESEGRKPHWRFKLSGETVVWDDRIRGEQKVDTASVSDPILVREDGSYLYTLPSIVDDGEFGVSHVVRGEDHVTNTGVQIEIFQALGYATPIFAHHPLLVAADGGPLSKRLGSLSVRGLREEGIEPMALLSKLAKIGTSDPVEPRHDLDALAADFAFEKIGRAPARFDPEELKRLNAQLLHQTPFEDVADRLREMGVAGGAAFWTVARANVETLADAAAWWRIASGPVTPVIEAASFAAAAAAALPSDPLDADSWGVWTGALKAETGRKGMALFMPLRLALTGETSGPDMASLLPLIGAEKARARLKGETA